MSASIRSLQVEGTSVRGGSVSRATGLVELPMFHRKLQQRQLHGALQ